MSYPPGYVEERIQILSAVVKAGDSHVEVASIIAEANNEDEAIASLKEKLDTSESGARAVMEMQFRNLMADRRDRIRQQLEELKNQS